METLIYHHLQSDSRSLRWPRPRVQRPASNDFIQYTKKQHVLDQVLFYKLSNDD